LGCLKMAFWFWQSAFALLAPPASMNITGV
jgi:hypothetical protein